jgi:fructose-1-phosphate kinase PfkB-like protein
MVVHDTQSFGGKGQLFARAANTILPGSATVVQFVGGPAGRFVCEQLDALGIGHVDVATAGETRTCTTVLSTAPAAAFPETELVGAAAAVSEAQVAELLCAIEGRLGTSLPTAIAMVGTSPPGTCSLPNM